MTDKYNPDMAFLREVAANPEQFDYLEGHHGDPLYALPTTPWRRFRNHFRRVRSSRLELHLVAIRLELRRLHERLDDIEKKSS